MKQIIINKNDSGIRLDSFLSKLLKDAPKSLIYKWIRKKRVKVNSKKAEISQKLVEGDELTLYINDEFFKESTEFSAAKNYSLNIVYEDENILIADKPSGLSAHSDARSKENNLLNYIRSYLYEKGEFTPESEHIFAPQLCHRIDKNTEGLVIAAKNSEALRIINEKLKNREIRKFYLLSVEGTLPEKRGEIRGFTKKDESKNLVMFYKEKKEGSKEAITKYQVLSSGKVLAELLTGRSHQIRASFSSIGHPLVGDVKYGAKRNDKTTYQELSSVRIIFSFKKDAGILNYLKDKVIESEKIKGENV